MTKKQPAKEFMYGVGFYWEGDSGAVGLYTHFNEVFYGTMQQAKKFQAYCQNRPDNKGKDKRNYKIFQLVEIPE